MGSQELERQVNCAWRSNSLRTVALPESASLTLLFSIRDEKPETTKDWVKHGDFCSFRSN